MRTADNAVKRTGGAIASWPALTGALASSLVLSATVAATAWSTDTRLGAPTYWPWLLTGLQVLALWAAGSKRWWGWLLGASVQPPWIAYALVTGQLGFIPGCAVSTVVQAYSFYRSRSQAVEGQKGSGFRRVEIFTLKESIYDLPEHRAHQHRRYRRWPGRAIGRLSPGEA